MQHVGARLSEPCQFDPGTTMARADVIGCGWAAEARIEK